MTDILTLRLDETSQAHFEALRQLHFPPERNQVPAHLTLFHALPGDPSIAEFLAASASSQVPFPIAVTGLRSLGKGVAYTLHAPELLALHRSLAASFAVHLNPQDRQRFTPHIVVQNKTTAEKARILLADLESGFEPWQITSLGLDLWHYLGGPWKHAQTFPFLP